MLFPDGFDSRRCFCCSKYKQQSTKGGVSTREDRQQAGDNRTVLQLHPNKKPSTKRALANVMDIGNKMGRIKMT